ncbi:MAG: hypothetical protein JSS49_10730 [Planctomycetes bacterium]|nr:hypothetical protein [Planctomycetota bacterium]
MNGSMRKVYCSLLLAFSASMFGLGCDGGAKPNMSGPPPKDTIGAPEKADGAKKETAAKPMPSGDGSTTGGGTEVPADAAGGTTEKPAATESKPEEKAEEKPEAKAEEKKAE